MRETVPIQHGAPSTREIVCSFLMGNAGARRRVFAHKHEPGARGLSDKQLRAALAPCATAAENTNAAGGVKGQPLVTSKALVV